MYNLTDIGKGYAPTQLKYIIMQISELFEVTIKTFYRKYKHVPEFDLVKQHEPCAYTMTLRLC